MAGPPCVPPSGQFTIHYSEFLDAATIRQLTERVEMFGIDKDKIKAAFQRFRDDLPLAGDDVGKKVQLIVQFVLDLERAIS